MVRVVVVVAVVLLAACNAGTAASPVAGTERGACYGNGTCDDGLTCLSDRCVRVEPGSGSSTVPPPIQPAAGRGDCGAVAEALVSLELGNYAPRDQRSGRASDIAALCRAQFVSEREAACLLEATRKDDLAACPKPLIVKALTEAEREARKASTGLPPECDEYLKQIERYSTCAAVPAAARTSLRQTLDQMKSSWAQMLASPTDPSARASIAGACRQAIDAMRQALAQLGC